MVDLAAGTSNRLLSASLGRGGIRLSANGRFKTCTDRGNPSVKLKQSIVWPDLK